ncbi:MAG: hypothetical protein AAGH40_12915, partial [Verrucomicrobiota bacterium]
QTQPETVQIEGPILVGDYQDVASVTATPGAIRYDATDNDFKGYDGSGWKSLTASTDSNPLDTSDLIISGEPTGTLNPWSGPNLYDARTGDVFASADRRFTASLQGDWLETDVSDLFDGNWSSSLNLAAGTTGTIVVDFSGKPGLQWVTYGKGKLVVGAYFTGGFTVTGARRIDRDGNVYDLSSDIENLKPSAGIYTNTVWTIDIPNNATFTQRFEIDILGGNHAGSTSAVAAIEYYQDRSDLGSALTLYRPETLYHTLSFEDPSGIETVAIDPEDGSIEVQSIELNGALTLSDGTSLLTSADLGSSSAGSLSELTIPNTTTAALSVATDGSVTLSAAQGDISMGSFGTN